MLSKVVTLERHIIEQQRQYPEASGEFSGLLRDLTMAIKIIAREVKQAGLIDILGDMGHKNVQGEVVRKLDEYADSVIYRAMDHGGHLCVMASEENANILTIPQKYPKGKYVLLFDPLDGSSNIDANVSIGTIFSIHQRISKGTDGTVEDCTQVGTKQVAAGYALYGSSVMIVYTTGQGVHGFTLDPSIGEFLLSHPNMKIPYKGKIYSINEGNHNKWDEPTKRFISHLREDDQETDRPYSLRYIGSLVSDVHRTLCYGGVFLYPADCSKNPPRGKLRLLYECAPMAFLTEQAGGMASTGTQRVMEVVPDDLHMRVPFVCGSPDEVKLYERFVQEHRNAKGAPRPAEAASEAEA